MGQTQKENDENKLFYQRIRHIAQPNLELESLRVKKILQLWFPMETGLGWVYDESTGQYVIN